MKQIQQIEAIFFDIDGTLVSFDTHRVPDSTRRALHLLREHGIKTFIATGRPRLLIDNLDGLAFDGYVTLNGSYCFTASGCDIHKRAIPRADVERLVAFLKKQEIPFTFFDDEDRCFVTRVDDRVRRMVQMHGIALPPELPAETALTRRILQLNGYFSDAEAQRLRIAQDVLPGCVQTRWSPLFADIMARGNCKEAGIDAVCAYYGISLSRTMAFGDGGNDIGMLRHVAVGVAMGNASDEVKNAADYVTDDVLSDGVWNALQHFGLLQRS